MQPTTAADLDGTADHPTTDHVVTGAPPEAPPVPVSIVVCPDGPLLVRGAVEILDAEGAPVPRRRRTVALCRCGASGLAPYCDGSHKVVGWRG